MTIRLPNTTILPMDPQIRLWNDSDSWPLSPVVDWLFGDGCRTDDPLVLLDGLSKILVEVGAPLWRIRLAFWTIHPVLAAYSHQWVRDKGLETSKVPHGIFTSPAYIGSPTEELKLTRKPVRYRLDDSLDPERHHEILFELRDQGGTDYYAVPMLAFNGQLDSLFLTTDVADGFSPEDIAKFDLLGKFLLPIVESISQHRLTIALLDTYVGQRTGQRVLEGRIKRGDGDVIEAALWFSDLRNFTQMTETLESKDLLDMLNTYFEFVFNAVTLYEGEVLRFIGDAMLIVFPTDKTGGRKRACDYALAAAEDALSGLATLNHLRRRHQQPEINFGVGLHVGSVLYGNVGAPSRLDFTVMGPAVNRTARLESLTKQTDSPLLMSRDFIGYLDRETRFMGDFSVKGIVDPIAAFALK